MTPSSVPLRLCVEVSRRWGMGSLNTRKEQRLSSVLVDSFTMRQASQQIAAILLLLLISLRFDIAAQEPAQGTPPRKPDRLVLSENLDQAPKEIIREGSVSQAHSGWKF